MAPRGRAVVLPPSTCSRLLLPHPEGPISAISSPGSAHPLTLKSTWRSFCGCRRAAALRRLLRSPVVCMDPTGTFPVPASRSYACPPSPCCFTAPLPLASEGASRAAPEVAVLAPSASLPAAALPPPPPPPPRATAARRRVAVSHCRSFCCACASCSAARAAATPGMRGFFGMLRGGAVRGGCAARPGDRSCCGLCRAAGPGPPPPPSGAVPTPSPWSATRCRARSSG
mmetsp:Transcript_15912/g.47144  ORF Transcript_15912/g.47144 Transcript_15912/m.47144 type:complete len:228 (-) Transcript_15912:269-952(-)